MCFEYRIAFAPLKHQLLITLDLFIFPVENVTAVCILRLDYCGTKFLVLFKLKRD
jgi:hypothetical protein